MTPKLPRKTKLSLISFAAGLAVCLVAVIFILFDTLDGFEARTRSWRFRLKGKIPLANQITLVNIDEKTLANLDWPIDRSNMALFIDLLQKYGAKTLGVDILYTDPDKKDARFDQLFGQMLSIYGNAVLGTDMIQLEEPLEQEKQPDKPGNSDKNETQLEIEKRGWKFLGQTLSPTANEVDGPILPILKGSHGLGHLNLLPDSAGILDRFYPLYQYRGKYYPSLSLGMLFNYFDLKEKHIRLSRDSITIKSPQFNLDIPLDQYGALWINFKGEMEQVEHYSFIDLLVSSQQMAKGGQPIVDLNKLKGKIVLLGQTAASIGDHGPVPFAVNTPLVLAHANALDNLLSGTMLSKASKIVDCLVLLVLGLIICFSTSFLTARNSAIVNIGVLAVFVLLNYLLFLQGTIIALFVPGLAMIICYLTASSTNHFVRDADERILKSAFSSFVSPGVMTRILDNPENLDLVGKKKRLTILFSDIKGYTTLSNTLSPDEILAILREYLDAMTHLIFKYEGTVDKIMGDGIMAFFGDPIEQPKHPFKAVCTAMDMQIEVARLVTKWESEGKSGLKIRIGIATGDVFVGNIGSKEHLEYTVLGPNVNLASRLETKAPAGGILISRETYLDVQDQVVCRPVGGLELKGYRNAYTAYQVLGHKGEVAEEQPTVDKAPASTPAATAEIKPEQIPERRNQSRFSIKIFMEFEYKNENYKAKSVDISKSGILVETDCPAKINEDIMFYTVFPINQKSLPLNVSGRVVRIIKPTEPDILPRLGLKFTATISKSKETLRYFIENTFLNKTMAQRLLEDVEEEDTGYIFRYNLNQFFGKILNAQDKKSIIDFGDISDRDMQRLKGVLLFPDHEAPRVYHSFLLHDQLRMEILRAGRYNLDLSLIQINFLKVDSRPKNDTDSPGITRDTKVKLLSVIADSIRNVDVIYQRADCQFVVIAPSTQKGRVDVIINRIEDNLRGFYHANPGQKDRFRIEIAGLTVEHDRLIGPAKVLAVLEQGSRGTGTKGLDTEKRVIESKTLSYRQDK